MKERLTLITIAVLAISFFAYRQSAESKKSTNEQANISPEIKPQFRQATAFAVSGKVSDIAPALPEIGLTNKKSADEKARAVPNKQPFRKQIEGQTHDKDSAIAEFSAAPMPPTSLSFDGISSDDSAAAFGFRIVPPDPNGDVGLNHYVQSVNALTRVFNKTGKPLTPPFKLSSVFAALGTTCSMRNDGDPIVLYDALTDRWLLSQYCNNAPPFRQLIAVSTTGDPTGAYYLYEFAMPNFKLNDYPKLSVWTDAFYMSADKFIGGDYAGTGVFAFDKSKMLAGDKTADYIYFDLASPSTIRLGGLLPADLDGLKPPPKNTPNIFVGYTANEYGDAQDALRLFNFHADFANPNNSTFTERNESPILTAPFDPTSPNGREDVEQPLPGNKLDSQSDRLMYRAAYRNFGTHESIVINQTVRISPIEENYRAGVRVDELQNTGNGFAVHEQATLGDAAASRWMGSAAQDFQGNTAVGHSFSSDQKFPSILYSGKLASDPPGQFRGEETLIAGTGVQTGFGSRWGDYTAMNIDPADDCTFWLTNEYYTKNSQTENPYGWLTRIGKFKFDECSNASRSAFGGIVTNAANGQPIADALVTANNVFSRRTDADGSYGELILVPNIYTLTVSAAGFRSQTITVTINNGETLIKNFALTPAAILMANNDQITAENCAVNNAIDAGETVTLEITLSNSGARNTENLTAVLLPTGGAINPGQPQNYGALETNGNRVSRPFTFTASPNLHCGAAIILTFQLNDGAENLGTTSINLNVGAPRFALRENFDNVNSPNLPNGWTTSASGAEQIWTTSKNAFDSTPNSAFSLAPSQIGINQLTSPAFQIASDNAELTFRQRYDLETTFLRNQLYDGGVLEIKIGNVGRFQDIISAGGTFETGGYDGTISGCCQNPLSGRAAWSGKSGVNQTPEFITTKVKLPASLAGKKVQLRWRVGTDNGTSREGQYVDDVTVADGFECACQTNVKSTAPFDFDGDGASDLSVFRPNDEANAPDFVIQNSSNNLQINTAWGSVGDIAVNADYDGDGKTDYAVFRPSSSIWYVRRSSNDGLIQTQFGASGDTPVTGDYDGDGLADYAIFRPSNGNWYLLKSTEGFSAVQFGTGGDKPLQADFDGDGKHDVAVYRSGTGFWYYLKSFDDSFVSRQFGAPGDTPLPSIFLR